MLDLAKSPLIKALFSTLQARESEVPGEEVSAPAGVTCTRIDCSYMGTPAICFIVPLPVEKH